MPKIHSDLLASVVVALVAVVGLGLVYSGIGSSPSGAASTGDFEQAYEAGKMCGSCMSASMANEPLPPACSALTEDGPVYDPQDNNAKGKCCDRACRTIQGGKRCGNICSDAASSPQRYGG